MNERRATLRRIRALPFDSDRERARSLLRTAIMSRLEKLNTRASPAVVGDRRGLAVEIVETLCEPQYSEALYVLSGQ